MDLFEELKETNQVLYYAKYQQDLKSISPGILFREIEEVRILIADSKTREEIADSIGKVCLLIDSCCQALRLDMQSLIREQMAKQLRDANIYPS